MTGIIALSWGDGAILVADTQSDQGNGMTIPVSVRKISRIGDSAMVAAGSGDAFVIERTIAALSRVSDVLTLENVGDLASGFKADAQRLTRERSVASAGADAVNCWQEFAAELLIVGYEKGLAWIIKVCLDGSYHLASDPGGSGGYAISGSVGNQLLQLAFGMIPCSSESSSKLVAYHALALCCELSRTEVGKPIQIATVTKGGASFSDASEIDALEVKHQEWSSLSQQVDLRMITEK